jgi:hypothetical protein
MKFIEIRNIYLVCPFIVLTFTFLVIISSCNQSNQPSNIEMQIANGKLLSQKYCVSCHQWPDPLLIDRKSWELGVLPAMGKQLGIKMYMGQYFGDQKSTINISDWQNIVTYYKSIAPISLKIPEPTIKPKSDWAIFSLKLPQFVNQEIPAMTTMISFNHSNNSLYTADAANNFFKWNAGLNSSLIYKFDSPVTGFSYSPEFNNGIVTCIGNLAPVNLKKGKVFLINLNNKHTKPSLITDSMPRAIQTVAADFNKDGLMDYVTCAFGHDFGGLYLIKQNSDHTYKKEIISNIAGGEQVITGDFNNDGWPDVMCLFAQADEGIRMFLNDRKGGFATQTLLRFPSIYGSSSFQLVDFNHDGKPDILYTCGDNSDYSKVLKPYHGVYIFTNQGNWKFKQTYFYHINGCTKAIASDFDHDGDFDIAAIAYFADFQNHPDEGFTYLEQTKPNSFTAHQIPISKYGRWLTMEVADIDNDGKDDIILGNFSTIGRGLLNQKGYTPVWNQHTPIIVLKNNAPKPLKK